MDDVKVEGMVNTLYHSRIDVVAEPAGDTMRDVEDEALADTLNDRLAEVRAGNVCQTLTDLNAISQVLTLAPRCQRWMPRQMAKH